MFSPFKQINRRSLLRYDDVQTGYPYLIRTYFSNAVDL